MALPTGLLEAVRNYLDITWVDPVGDEKLSGIIARGIKYIDGIAGSVMDYIEEGKPRELLFDYCRYVRSNALNEFQQNYMHELLTLQISCEVKAYEALANLSSLAIGTLILTPAFDPGVRYYTTNTINAQDIITAVAVETIATIQIINGTTLIANGSVATWVDGENTVTITVTNGSVVTIYTIVVTKS